MNVTGSESNPIPTQAPQLKSSRPGSFLGFSLQSTRMCLHLCDALQGSYVALEVFDDTDVHHADGSGLLEQAKSGLVTNPISIFSVDLWKTFANWIDVIEAGLIDLSKTRFRLYVLQKKDGEFANHLHFAHTRTLVDRVVQEIRDAYEAEKPEQCKPYIEKFLDYDEAKRADLVMAFELETGNDDLIGRISNFFALTVPDDRLEDACNVAIGWVKNNSDALIAARRYPALSRNAFKDYMSTFVSRSALNLLKTYTVPAPSEDEIEECRPLVLTLLRQLDLIDKAGDGFEAVSDFLQSKTNKVRWGEKGLVCDQDFEVFRKTLFNKWELLNKKTNMTYPSASEQDKGQLLKMECMDISEPLDGTEPPRFFVRGTYQEFANVKKIGWHPRYLNLLED